MRGFVFCAITGSAVVAALAPRAGAGLIVPQYNSLPGATAKLYLDFDGDVTPTFGIYSPGTTIAYDIDGDPANFSPQELENIRQIWSGVAEKYSPFNINVTTVEPPNLNNNVATKVVIGGSGDWAPAGAGGIAAYQSFMTGEQNLAFVFPGHLGNGLPKYVTESAAHEAGHGFALRHQSLYDVNQVKIAEYNPGDANHAPIMGNSYFSARGQWWRGPDTDGPTLIQDDLRLLSAIGTARPNFGYRPDDHGSNYAAADPLAVDPNFTFSAHGVVEQVTDSDFFSFATTGGTARIVADVNPESPMLDLSLNLYDSAGNLLASSATPSLGESLTLDLPAGTYEFSITSAGGYGDIGQYFLSGQTVPEPSSLLAASAAATVLLLRRRRASL